MQWLLREINVCYDNTWIILCNVKRVVHEWKSIHRYTCSAISTPPQSSNWKYDAQWTHDHHLQWICWWHHQLSLSFVKLYWFSPYPGLGLFRLRCCSSTVRSYKDPYQFVATLPFRKSGWTRISPHVTLICARHQDHPPMPGGTADGVWPLGDNDDGKWFCRKFYWLLWIWYSF